MNFPDERIDQARKELSDFVSHSAAEAALRVGFSYRPDPLAPGTYEGLLSAWERSIQARQPLPVLSTHCYGTVYDSPEVNLQFRFWHDTEHVRMGMGFSAEDELEVAWEHLNDAARWGLEPYGVAWQLLRADTVGNIEASVSLGRFPIDGLGFGLNCLRYSTDEAIRVERERYGQGPS